MEKVVKFIILVCFFISCEKYEGSKYCLKMTISNSVPIQFWVNGEETYNEKNVCGITRVCWCQPFQCDDEVRIKFTDTPALTNVLVGIFSDGSSFYIPFVEISAGQYELIFTATEHEICDEQIEFIIRDFTGLSILDEPSSWSDAPPFDPFDSKTTDTFVNSSSGSQGAYQAMTGGEGDNVVISYTVTISGIPMGGGAMDIDFVVADSSGTPISLAIVTPNQSNFTEDGVYELLFNRTIDSATPAGRLYLYCSYIGGGTPTATIELTPNSVINAGLAASKAKSDCISFKTIHSCTLLMSYSNATSFDGIVDSSPIPVFNLRIPAVFFEEENTQEQEDIELSNDEIVRLYDKIEEKRLMRIGFMPHYMHRKVVLALAYDFVEIDGKYWIRRDEYKKNEGDRHYPLKTAQVQLTDKNFIKENQL
jgi:hypothetical protein